MWLVALRSAAAVVSVFLVCVVVHEFGHFIVAKRCGVAVPAFAVGFGPKIVRWMRGGTEFSIRLLPLGGLVQLAGEIPQDALFRRGEPIAFRLDERGRIVQLGEPADVPGGQVGTLRDLDLTNRLQMTIATSEGTSTYAVVPHARLMTNPRSWIPIVERREQVLGKPLWQRASMILAGPAMNFLLAGVLFSLFFTHTGIGLNTPTLGKVVPGSPAAQAQLAEGDRVLSVDGRAVATWIDLVEAIRSDTARPPRPLVLRVERGGQVRDVVVTPRLVQGVPQLGVNEPVSHDPVLAWKSGFAAVYATSVNALHMYGQIVAHHQIDNLAGPVGIADVISQQAQSGVWQVVMIAGLLSLNLGLFNLLPIPALDGGRLLFMVIEMFRGRSVDPRKEGLVHFVGFALLMLFAVVITFHDVVRLF
ncbi:MAG: site-2 protease family protein [Alicyclobacillaceae bacterium]|nr:site-2 protease family protein [Alicyclobacillaceae bacterium]